MWRAQKRYLAVSTGHRVNDGLWHSASLSSRGLQVTMTLDNEPSSTMELGDHMEAGDSLYFGGKATHTMSLVVCITVSWDQVLVVRFWCSFWRHYLKMYTGNAGWWKYDDLATVFQSVSQVVRLWTSQAVRTPHWHSRGACVSSPSTASPWTWTWCTKDD